jgi:hypothetical protein
MKHTGVDAATAARQWRHYNQEADRVKRLFPPGSWLTLHYEQLCAEPQATLDRIASFIGVEPAPIPTSLGSVEDHIIGNSMRLKGVGEIREDQTWREVLSENDVDVIARITGSTSRRLGFDWPRPRSALVPSA